MMQKLDDQELAIWSCLVESHRDFSLVSREFLTGNIDRVAIIQHALRSGQGKHTALYLLQALSLVDLQGIFDELVFQASYAHGGIGVVQKAIVRLPREWVLSRIEVTAEPLLVNGTYDEYRRFLELYRLLDRSLLQRLTQRALRHPDPDIQEAGQDFDQSY